MAVKYRLIARANPQDRLQPKKFYAMAIQDRVFKLKDLASELASRSTTASEGDVYAVLIGLRDLIRDHLDRSDKVVIDGIGSFVMSITSDGADSEAKFNQSFIKKVKVNYQEDSEMKAFSKNVKVVKEASR